MSKEHTTQSHLSYLEKEVRELKACNQYLRDKIGKLNDRIQRLIKLGLETSEYGLQNHREMWEREEEL